MHAPILLPPTLREYARERGYKQVTVTSSGADMLYQIYGVPLRPGPHELMRSMGDSGVRVQGGRIDDLEHNPKLTPDLWRGNREPGIVHEMVRGDPVCAAIARAWRLHLAAVPIDVEPAEPKDGPSLRLAEFVRANLWEYMRGGMGRWREEASGFPIYTPGVWELVWGVDDRAGAAHGFDGPAVILQALEPRMPWTIQRWVRQEGDWSIQQYATYGDSAYMDDGRPVPRNWQPPPIHWRKLLRLTHDPLGDDPEGTSLHRPNWAPWTLRQIINNLKAIAAQRGAHSVPLARPGPNANPGDIPAVKQALRHFAAGAEQYLMLPATDWELELPKIDTILGELSAVFDAAGRDMTVGALVPWLVTGTGGTGSYALIDGQMDPYKLALEASAAVMVRAFNEGPDAIIKQIVDQNAPGVRAYPWIKVGRLALGSLSAYLGMVKDAVATGIVLPDMGLDEWYRDRTGAPVMSEESRAAWRYRLQNAGGPVEIVAPPAPGIPPTSPPTPPPPSPAPPAEPIPEERTDESTDRAAVGDAIRRADAAGLALAERRVIPSGHTNPDMPVSGPRGRPLRPIERTVRLSETTTATTAAKERIGSIIAEWSQRQGETFIGRVIDEAVDIKGARRIPVGGKAELVAALTAEYWRVYQAGSEAVARETARLRRDPELREQAASGDLSVGKGGDIRAPKQLHDHGPECRHEGLLDYLAQAGTVHLGDQGQPPTDREWTRFREAIRSEFYAAHPEVFAAQGGSYVTRKDVSEDAWRSLATEADEFRSRFGTNLGGVAIPLPEHFDDPINAISPGRAISGIAGTTADKAAGRVRDTIIDAAQSQTVAGVFPGITAQAAASAIGSATAARAYQRTQEAMDRIDLKATLGEILGTMSGRWDDDTAGKDINALFGLGRVQQSLAEPGVGKGMYSTLLESDSCEECLARDGDVFPLSELSTYATPASWCLGQDRCRCLVLMIPDD
jgi:hypothetical protein